MVLDTSHSHEEPIPPLDVPKHVAIIMDGNGRWAQRKGMPRLVGHRAGTERIRRVLSALEHHGVGYVTIYAFSTENWGRPQGEVYGLLGLLEEVIGEEVPKLHQQNVRILHLGTLERLPTALVSSIQRAVALTAGNTGLTLSVGFDYGGRAEIVEAVRRIMEEGIRPEEVTEEVIRHRLYLPEVPDPDLIIRTAGEQRLSNFLIWQAAYSEMYYTPICWPDFDEAEVEMALEAYRQRERRFGKLLSEA
jgi:undecaprenyl diphosphate synthase